MMARAKAIDISHKEKGIEQTHTWDSTTKTCTPIIYSQTVTESDDVEQTGDGEEEENFLPLHHHHARKDYTCARYD